MNDIMLINLPAGTEKRGLNMAPPHGYLVFGGRKTAIAKARPFDLSGPWILVSGGKAFGTMEVALPAPIGIEEFDGRFGEHCVSTKERARWWPESTELYLSKIDRFDRFEKPVGIKTYPGMQTVLEVVTFDGEEPCLDEHCKAVRRLLDETPGEEEKAMPYDPSNPPEKISHLPAKVQRQWVHVFNSCMEEHGDEGKCHTMANGVVKQDKALATAFKTFKATDGRDWLLTWSTNGFEDRERETFRTKAIEDYVERHAADEVKGEYWFWHIPGTKFADILWQAVVGRFLVEAGPFDDTPIGRKMAAFFGQHPASHPEIAPEGWGTSHGYYYVPHDRKDGIYDWFEKFETTVLPQSVASNQHSPRMEVLTKMNQEQASALEAISGADLVEEVIETTEQRTEELEAKGVTFKSLIEDAPEEKVEAVATEVEAVLETDEDVKEEDSQAEGIKALAQQILAGLDLGGLATSIKQQQEEISAMTAKLGVLDDVQDRLKALEDIGVAEASPIIPLTRALQFQASKLIQTEAKEKSADVNAPTMPTAIAEMAKRAPF